MLVVTREPLGDWLVVAYPTATPGLARRQRTTSTIEAKTLVATWTEAVRTGELQVTSPDAK